MFSYQLIIHGCNISRNLIWIRTGLRGDIVTNRYIFGLKCGSCPTLDIIVNSSVFTTIRKSWLMLPSYVGNIVISILADTNKLMVRVFVRCHQQYSWMFVNSQVLSKPHISNPVKDNWLSSVSHPHNATIFLLLWSWVELSSRSHYGWNWVLGHVLRGIEF